MLQAHSIFSRAYAYIRHVQYVRFWLMLLVNYKTVHPDTQCQHQSHIDLPTRNAIKLLIQVELVYKYNKQSSYCRLEHWSVVTH
jgi:hypothetical protein